MEYVTINQANTDILQKILSFAKGKIRDDIEAELRRRSSDKPSEENCTPHKFITNDIYY